MVIHSPKKLNYKVQESLIGETDCFRLYPCLLPDGKPGILKIAVSKKHNGLLDKEAFLLRTMQEDADKAQEAYALEKGSTKFLNYHFCFPNLVESFISKDQDNRRVLILSFSAIAEKLQDLSPLSHIVIRDNLRVDPRTSAWILGKLLKLLVFTQSNGISIGFLDADNILINRKKHFVSVFDWSRASIGQVPLNKESSRNEIIQVTKEVIRILGGNTATGEIPSHEQLVDSQYEDFLKKLLRGQESDSFEAHKKFYELIWSLWPRGFHKFSTHLL